jgi:peptidoglycan/LPS O-acetylase OafA/YrhL
MAAAGSGLIEPPAARRQEIKSLTSLRGVAALLVVMYHFRKEFGTALALDSGTKIFALGWIWVDFFFVLSGFVMAYVYSPMFSARVTADGYEKFMLRRLGRVYPLHLVTLLLFIPTELAKLFVSSGADPAFSHNTGLSIATNLLLVQAWHIHPHNTWNQPSWSISAEFFSYLLFPFLALALSRVRAAAGIATAAACLAALWLLATLHGSLDASYDWGIARCLPAFTIGMLLCRWHAAPPSALTAAIGSDTALAAVLLLTLLLLHLGVEGMPIVMLFCALVLSASLNAGRVGRLLSARPLHTLGVLSYSIYMTHGLVQRGWQFAFDRLGPLSTPAAVVILLALLALTIAISAATYRYVEVPGRELFNGLARRRGKVRALP